MNLAGAFGLAPIARIAVRVCIWRLVWFLGRFQDSISRFHTGMIAILKAEEALETMKTSKSRDWRLTTAYYAIYHGILPPLFRLPIECC